MAGLEDDYVLRIIRRLAEFVAALVAQRRVAEAQQAVDEAARDALGLDLATLARLDDGSVMKLLVAPDRLDTYAALLEQQAIIVASSGDAARAQSLRSRARALLEQALARGHSEPKAIAARIAALARAQDQFEL